MRTQISTWKQGQTMEQIAARLEDVLGWQEAEKNVYEEVMVKNGTVPQFVSQTGNATETEIGRIVHERTNRPNRTWDERGQDAVEDAKQLEAEEEARQVANEKKWKTKEQEYENILDSLSKQTY